MKVLIISHAYVAEENRKKLEALSRYEDLEIGVAMPREWKTWHEEKLKIKNEKLKISNGYAIFALPAIFPGDGGRHFYEPFSLWRALRAFGPDIIQIEEEPWTLVMFEIVLLNTLFFHKRLIVFSWENLDLKLGWWRTLVERFTFGRAALAIAGSSEARERLRQRCFAKRIEVLPQFGVDQKKFKVKSQKSKVNLKIELGLSEFVVGFVGRLVEEKGLGTLFEAVAKLSDGPDLLLVSTMPKLPDKFQELADTLGISDCLRVVSGVPHQELPRYLNLMDIFVLPSLTTPTWKEQFGRVLIEAMVCNVPVIGSSSGAIPEVVSDAGLVFSEGDAGDLKSKIETLMLNEKRRLQLAEAGYRRVLGNFTFERIARRSRAIYRSL